jgi:hypothetical protein
VELFYVVGGNVFLIQTIIFLWSPRYRAYVGDFAKGMGSNTPSGRGIVRQAPSVILSTGTMGLVLDVVYFFVHEPTDPATKISEYRLFELDRARVPCVVTG